jgi:hypothetical protein
VDSQAPCVCFEAQTEKYLPGLNLIASEAATINNSLPLPLRPRIRISNSVEGIPIDYLNVMAVAGGDDLLRDQRAKGAAN